MIEGDARIERFEAMVAQRFTHSCLGSVTFCYLAFMSRVLVYFDSPPNQKMAVFAAWKAGRDVDPIAVDDPARALALLEDGPWDLAIIGFVPGESVVEAYAREGIPTLVGVCVDTPEHEIAARQQGATLCWRWPMQAHFLTAMVQEQLARANEPRSEPGQ
ncbi:MAG: hypothetical protein R6X02_35575 [Enhygromyxa sp.]